MSGECLPDGYLDLCSLGALESLVLSRMDQAAELRKQAQQSLQLWTEAEADVKVAQWMLDLRRRLDLRSEYLVEAQAVPVQLGPPQAELFAPNSLTPCQALAKLPPLPNPALGEPAPHGSHPALVLNRVSGRRSRRSRLQRAALPLRIGKCQRGC